VSRRLDPPAEHHRPAPRQRPARSPLWRRPDVRRLLVVTVLGFTSFCLTLAALPFWAVHGGGSPAVAGTVTTVMLTSTVLTQLALPWLLARFGTGPVLVAGLVALGAPSPLLALSADLGPLLGCSVVRGAGFAVLTVVGSTMTATVAPRERHGESAGLYGLAIAVPQLVAVPLGVALTQQGWFWVVSLLAASPILAIPTALALGRGASGRPDGDPASSPAPGSHRTTVAAVLGPSLMLFTVTLAGGGVVTLLPIARPDGASAALALVLLGLVAAVSRWRVGALVVRIDPRLLLVAGLAGSVAGLLLLAAGLWRLSDGAILVGAAVFGAGYGVVQNVTLVVAFDRAGEARTTTASSAWNAAFDTGTATGAGALGAVAALGLGLPGAFVAAALMVLASVPLAAARAGSRPRRRRRGR
jgi:predicted MFS family arabinose efflux permease